MSLCVLEFNDIALTLADARGLRLHSPGIASLGSDAIQVGGPALAQARLNPRQSIDRFWLRLGTEPLHQVHPQARHHADLAYLQLLQLYHEGGEPQELLFAVPASFDKEQLAILLGIAQRCPFRAVGLVDAALAAATTTAIAASAVHLDLQLHQCVLTHLVRDGASVQRGEVKVIPGAGLGQMQQLWARHASAEFIRQTRFDPLHSAATEQQLYDQLPAWLEAMRTQQDISVELRNGGTSYQAKLATESMLQAVRPLYRQLAAALLGSDAPLLLSPRAARLPRLEQQLGPDFTVLGDLAVTEGCLRHQGIIRSDQQALRFITRLPLEPGSPPASPPQTIASAAPVSVPEPAPAATPAAQHKAQPTHLALGTRVWQLRQATHYLYLDDEGDWQLNLRMPPGAALQLSWDGSAWWISPGAGCEVQVDGVPARRATRVDTHSRIGFPAHEGQYAHLLAQAAVLGNGA